MKFSKALRRLLLGYLVLHLAAAALFVFVLSRTVENQMVRDAQAKMDAMAILLAEHVGELDENLNSEGLASYVREIGLQTGMRFTLITDDGMVVTDSITGNTDIRPHGTREEILLARESGTGFAQRQSDTLNKSMMYWARELDAPDRQKGRGFVRVAVPSESINEAIDSIQRYVWLFAFSLGALTAFLMIIFSARNLRPLDLFSAAAERIGDGKYGDVSALHRQDDEWGELADAFGQMQSELEHREGRLTENSQRLEAVLSSMIEGVLAIEPSGEVMLANGAACRMLMLTRDKLIGRRISEVVRVTELNDAIEKSREERTFSKTEFKTFGESSRILKARVSMLADQDKPGLAVVLHDVTELRQLETMREDFVANVSHELKTPLASIKAYAETLRLGAIHDQDKNMQFLEQIEFQADTLNQQIQDLLQLARVESGEKTFSIQDVKINPICQSLHNQFLDSAANRQLELGINLEIPGPIARCDPDAIETVIKNLVVNAIHYTPEGGSVSILTKLDGDFVVISVIDTGIGIAQDQQARVFERFYRVDKARSRDMGGTGLGLAIVKHLTQAFGGTVTLESQLGKGSKFHVRLPRARG